MNSPTCRSLNDLICPIAPGGHYISRETRSEFIAKHFDPIIKGKLLDVGCFEKALQSFLPRDIEYLGIDLYGKPDIVFDLESGPLPVKSRSFDVVVCADVLEHLENIHRVFDELLRVSREYVIVALPNCWHGNWRWVFPWKEMSSGKYYGLPKERPIDRHRWFFNATEAVNFLHNRAIANNCRIEMLDFVIPQSLLKRFALRVILQSNYTNWAASSIWAVVKIAE